MNATGRVILGVSTLWVFPPDAADFFALAAAGHIQPMDC